MFRSTLNQNTVGKKWNKLEKNYWNKVHFNSVLFFLVNNNKICYNVKENINENVIKEIVKENYKYIEECKVINQLKNAITREELEKD